MFFIFIVETIENESNTFACVFILFKWILMKVTFQFFGEIQYSLSHNYSLDFGRSKSFWTQKKDHTYHSLVYIFMKIGAIDIHYGLIIFEGELLSIDILDSLISFVRTNMVEKVFYWLKPPLIKQKLDSKLIEGELVYRHKYCACFSNHISGQWKQ